VRYDSLLLAFMETTMSGDEALALTYSMRKLLNTFYFQFASLIHCHQINKAGIDFFLNSWYGDIFKTMNYSIPEQKKI